MNLDYILNRLWSDYSSQNPSAAKIYDLFSGEGETVVNDHIAFRTVDYAPVSIEVLSRLFISNGYVSCGEYEFKDKHLFARHYELPGDKNAPRVFISQLILDECSDFIRNLFKSLIEKTDLANTFSEEVVFSGSIFNPPSFEIYNKLREESEYAAWFYVFGFRANHFTVSINSLTKYNDIYKVNELLKKNGFILNSSGGEVKGSKEELLQQSSTMADIVTINFIEGDFEIPSCYYEFAQRFPDTNGELYSGFIAKSADKIFESTNFYRK